MKSLSRLAVTNDHFKCNKTGYIQSDDLAMGASLAVNLETLDTKLICIDSNLRVTV